MGLQLSNMSYNPSTWYPENGGNVNISYTINVDPANIPETVTATVPIRDSHGNIVKTLTQEIPTNGQSSVNASLAWDGTDSTGARVSNGRYAPSLEASAEGYEPVSEDFCSGITVGSLCPGKSNNRQSEKGADDETVLECDITTGKWVSRPKAGGPKAEAASAAVCEPGAGDAKSETSGEAGAWSSSVASGVTGSSAGFSDPMSKAGFLGTQGLDSAMSKSGYMGQNFSNPTSWATRG